MSKKSILALVALLAIAVVCIVLFMTNLPTDNTVGEADLEIQATALLKEYEEDEATANQKYLDKVLAVEGTIKEVMEQDNAFVVLLGEEGSVGSVSCTLNAEDESVAYGVKAGDPIHIKGRCTGFLLDVVLVDCVLLNE